jgi:hypothetical protein
MSRFQDWTSADERKFNEMQVRRTLVLSERREQLETALRATLDTEVAADVIESLIANAGPICDALANFRNDLPEGAA